LRVTLTQIDPALAPPAAPAPEPLPVLPIDEYAFLGPKESRRITGLTTVIGTPGR
jgi:hypothetical protein